MAKLSCNRTFRLSFMIVLNFLCFVMEIIVGTMCHSMVLTADAFNVLSDFLGVVIALISLKLAGKGPSERNTFGWTRGDVLGALINSVFMIALCITIIIGSLQLFVEPELVDQPQIVIIVGIVGGMINVIGLFVLKDYRSIPKEEIHIVTISNDDTPQVEPKSPQSVVIPATPSQSRDRKKGASSHMNMYGAFLHVLGDALGSVVVVICAIIDWKVHVMFLQYYLDPILSAIMAVFLIISSYRLMKESSLTLLQAVPTKVNLMNLKSNIKTKSRHIMEIKDLHVWQLTSEQLVASVRIVFDRALPLAKVIALVAEVESCFYAEGIHVVTVHPEVNDNGDTHSLIVDGTVYESFRRQCSHTFCRTERNRTGINLGPSIKLRASYHGQSTRSIDDDTVHI